MRIIDLIEKKKRGEEHSREEINFIIDSLQAGVVQEYQISAWLMAVYFSGMTEDEVYYLTDSLIQSGDVINLYDLTSSVVDFNTTGGVGDKVAITLMPLLVASGIRTIKLLGRGIGYTGGTIDKLESIPGFNTGLPIPDLINYIRKFKFAVSSQVKNLTPLNRTLQVLKYATATSDSIPLIAASVVSKRVATGADNIIVDVKYGSGALVKSALEAEKLSNLIIKIGKRFNKTITVIITSVDEPIGRAVGNAIEVIEAIEFLKGRIQDSDLAYLTYEFGAVALMQLKRYENKEQAIEYLKHLVMSGVALEKFSEIIRIQKGNKLVIDNYDKFPLPMYKIKCVSEQAGYVNSIDAYKIARACSMLGAIRNRKSDEIDKSVGIFLNKKSGEKVEIGETIFTVYSNNKDIEDIRKYCMDAFSISNIQENKKELIHNVIRDN